MRDAVLPYARHLAEGANAAKQRIEVSDLLTVLSICKQAFTAEEMLEQLSPKLLALITEQLLPAVAYRKRGPAITALAHLSDHPLWYQKMVMLGFADEVSGPNRFKKYEDFINAIYAIDEGRWPFDAFYLHELTAQNVAFTSNFKCEADKQVYLRLCERYKKFFEDFERKYLPSAD